MSTGLLQGASVRRGALALEALGSAARPVALEATARTAADGVRALGAASGLEGEVTRADAETVRRATGFSIGGVAPVGHPAPLPCAIDASLGHFARIRAAAGHPLAVFETDPGEFARLTGDVVAPIGEAGRAGAGRRRGARR